MAAVPDEKYQRANGDGYKVGFIDKTGRFAIDPKYDWAESFENGIAKVYSGDGPQGHLYRTGKWGYINLKGDYIWEPTN